tara:strand:- start:146 stop:373 length:228 start_codon:yes stop_codon:yes gene_type:complete
MTLIIDTLTNDPTVCFTISPPNRSSISEPSFGVPCRIVYRTEELAREAQLDAAHQVGTVIPIRATRRLAGDMFVE